MKRQFEQPEESIGTVLAAELRGYVALAEPLPPDQVASVLDAYYRGFAQCVGASGATLVRFRGSTALAAWDLSLGLDRGATAAVEAARLLTSMQHRPADGGGVSFPGHVRLGIGIATGSLFIGAIGPDTDWLDMVGDIVNTAIMLASAASSGEILMTEDAVRALSSAARVEETDPLTMPGKRRRVSTYRLYLDL